jgi:Dolichyl-phosphate-mannose-protein mannosyltransferase
VKPAVAERTFTPSRQAGVWQRARVAALESVRRHASAVVVGSTVLLVVAADVVWRTEETRPPHFDMAGHLWKSLFFRDYLVHFHPVHFLGGYFYYPPLTYWVTAPFYVVFGTSMWVAVLSNIVFVAVLALSTYGLGRLLWSQLVGLLATLFVLACPIVVTQFKEYQLDAPLTAMVALALYLLVRAGSFSSRRYSLLFGVACGLGLLTKWTFPLALAGPVLFAVFEAAVAPARPRSLEWLKNVALAAASTFAVAGPWYLAHSSELLRDIPRYSLKHSLPGNNVDPAVLSVPSAVWYLRNLLDPELYIILAGLFVVGLLLCLGKRDALRRNGYPLALVFGTYVSFTLLSTKDARYTLPLLPGVAIVATCWVDALRTRLRLICAAGITAIAVAMFWVVSFGTSLLPVQVIVSVGGEKFALFAQRGYLIGPPTHEKWQQEEIVHYSSTVAPGATAHYEGLSTIWFNKEGALYYMMREGLREIPKRRQAEVLMVRSASTPRTPRGFVALRRFSLPDGSVVTVDRRPR